MSLQIKVAGALISFLLLWSCASGLYEDQIKKFDWLQQNIGGLEYAHLDLNHFQPRLLVSTREHVLASLCPKTGELVWRQVLEKSARGNIKLFQISGTGEESTSTAAAHPNSNLRFDLLTVQGDAPALVRGWNSNRGTIEFEWSLMPIQTDRAQDAIWFYSNSFIYHVLPTWSSHLEVTQYFATSGRVVGTTSKIAAAWIKADKCVQSGTYFVCLDGNTLKSLDLTSDKNHVKQLLGGESGQKLESLMGLNGVVIVGQKLVHVQSEDGVCANLRSASFIVGIFNQRRVIVQADVHDNLLKISATYLDSCTPVEELQQSLPYSNQYGTPKLRTFDCKTKRGPDGKGCLYVLDTNTDSILAVQQNKLRWVREESLANVVATEFIDLPLADTEGTLENEIKGKTGDIATAFVRRVTTQAIQIKNIFLHVIGLGPPPTDSQRAGLVRDSFGLHKMLVVLTKSGKIFGIDNINGKQHWQYYLPQAEGFGNDQQMRLIVQRSSKHFPLEPLCAVVAKNKASGNGVLFFFNPITGRGVNGGTLQLDYRIKQIALLAETENDFIQGVLVMDAHNKVNVYPSHAADRAHGLYLYTADSKTAELNGYNVKLNEGQLTTIPIWNVRLSGSAADSKIIAVAAKNPNERVHSQGRVLGDRSVLYKYINPNLVGVVTQASDPTHKTVLNLHLVDVVSGSVIFSMAHRRVRPPVSIVHSENWLAYTYYNDKVRRTEISTIELYEGKTQANSSVWSSWNAPPMPLIERQSYIVPTSVETLRETITERGITNKHVLFGTASGAIIEMPWALLDPRRPIASSTQGREEAAIPYIPELPLSTESFINYNQTIARLSNIYTAPSGLESTCLVVATGLDIFVTRVAPSKTFDLLKEDFDYILISIVLVALTTGSLVVKHLASRKLLKQAWK